MKTLTDLTNELEACTLMKRSEIRQLISAIRRIVTQEIEETGTSATLFYLAGVSKNRKRVCGAVFDEI